jgi:hypothetical protein
MNPPFRSRRERQLLLIRFIVCKIIKLNYSFPEYNVAFSWVRVTRSVVFCVVPRMDNPETLTTLGTQNKRRKQAKQNTKHNMCWTPLYASID